MKKANMCPHCGGNLILTNNLFTCEYCNALFDEYDTDCIENKINEALDEIKQGKVAELRRRLWDETHKEYLNKNEILNVSREIRNYFPDDLLANFYEKINNSNASEINEFLNDINYDDSYSYMDIIIEYMLKVSESRNLSTLKNIIEKTYKDKNKEKYDKYLSKQEKISEDIKNGRIRGKSRKSCY